MSKLKEMINPDDLPTTFDRLKKEEDAFYTAAQTIAGKRIDENCREGLLAYRHYLKTIVSAMDRVYGYLEDGRKALEALEGETDSDVAHTLITQLEIDEKLIYEELQSLRTHYKYNADTKQWDKVTDTTFVSQLEEFEDLSDVTQLPDKYLTKDRDGHLIDKDGKRIVQIKDETERISGEYYMLSNDGKSLASPPIISTPVAVYWKNSNGNIIDGNGHELTFKDDGPNGAGYYYKDNEVWYKSDPSPCFYGVWKDAGGNKFALFSDREGNENDKWYKLDSKGRPFAKVEQPTGALTSLGWQDEDGDTVKQWVTSETDPKYGKWFKLDGNGNFTENEATIILLRDDKAFLLTSGGDRIMKFDGDWYQLDADGKLTMVRSALHYTYLQALRDTKIACTDSTDPEAKRVLNVFNSITLLDQLRYIRYYYELILKLGATDYSVFPNSAETGYPCLPDVKSTEATQDTKNLGALEVFYVGYLIDRDGPINAVSSFFEVKTAALRNNLSLQSQKITALNIYLDFINRGMDVLNQSQANGKKRVPDGAQNALTYLCGGKMYNLFEYKGVKYLVIPCTEKSKDVNKGKFRLIRADDSGKDFLLGADGERYSARAGIYVETDTEGKIKTIEMYDPCGAIGGIPEEVRYKYKADKDKQENQLYVAPSQIGEDYKQIFAYYMKDGVATYEIIDDFVLPTQLEVSTIIPGSVKGYLDFSDPGDDQKHTAMIESWTNALSNKTQYINTAIDTINTDVSVDRSKIDTFDSLTSTFRSRAQDVYLNTAANIRG